MAEVSIILPVYNSEKYIKNTINSILNQTYQDYELLIIDDASTDNSLNIVNELKNDKFIILKNEKNKGVAFSRNKGINKAKGRFIAFIDSDDIWEKEKLEKQIKFMKDKDIAFSFTSYKRIKEDGEEITNVNAPYEVDYEELLKNTIILNSTIMLDTLKIDKDLIQMPEIRITEDTAMYLKILRNGCKAYGLNEILLKYTVRNKSLSSNKFKSMLSLWKVYKNYEHIGFLGRVKNISSYARNAIKKRIPKSKFKRIKEIFDYLTFKQILDILLFPLFFVISLFCKPFFKDIWIIEENPNEACDNGYIFFKYLRENRKDINAYYVIKKKSKDYKKVELLGNIIIHGGLKHWVYYLNAKKIIVTQKYANPSRALFHILHKYSIKKTPRIFLQHGVIKDYCKMFNYSNTKFRIFICGAKREYEFIKEKFGYPEQNVVYTGLARFDNLNLASNNKDNMILICPTWRNWIKTQKEFDIFMNYYYNLLSDNELIKRLEEKNIFINFVMHKNMNKFKFKDILKSKNIIINHNEDVNIQDLINKASLFITDYSSIFMDIAYRKVPMVFYQFDRNEYREKQLPEGYFSYEKDGFGDVLETTNDIIDKVEYYINNNFEIEEKYAKRMDKFFERKDKNNCKRILEEIERI